ncbi:hypothetical protein V496_03851 [Pseudogymnoascus sp. VKM F-4515 (FW-2607)]|nr:hypothetical protein V496_03851 [Pseudogymnoascus sp. VKM F-4515 (FW-2607)]
MSSNPFVIDIIQVYTFVAHQVFLRVGHAADIDMTLTRSVYSKVPGGQYSKRYSYRHGIDMYLFTVAILLAVQGAVVHAVPPSFFTKYAYQRDIGHDASLTISTVQATPTVGIHGRDRTPGVSRTTAASRIPVMPALDQVHTTILVTHTTTKTVIPTETPDLTTTITTTLTKTTTLAIKGIATGYSNTMIANNASLSRTVSYNTLSKNITASTENKCGAKVGQTCISNSEGRCCSRFGYCGGTDAHCGVGCQSGFGVCGAEGVIGKNSTVRGITCPPRPKLRLRLCAREASLTSARRSVPETFRSFEKVDDSSNPASLIKPNQRKQSIINQKRTHPPIPPSSL